MYKYRNKFDPNIQREWDEEDRKYYDKKTHVPLMDEHDYGDHVFALGGVLLYRAHEGRKQRGKKCCHLNWWWGRCGGSNRRMYKCHICGETIDTESQAYPMTRHACDAIDEHRAYHLMEEEQLEAEKVVGID